MADVCTLAVRVSGVEVERKLVVGRLQEKQHNNSLDMTIDIYALLWLALQKNEVIPIFIFS